MRPSADEIERAAYDRWERRGWTHGGDRDDWLAAEKEQTFHARYRMIVEYPLDGTERHLVVGASERRCRFCERSARQTEFDAPRPVVPGRASLLTGEVCEECQTDWRDGLEHDFRDFWSRLSGRQSPAPDAVGHNVSTPTVFSVAAFKAVAASALAMLPPAELHFFVDTLEWVSNPDHDVDDQLLDGAECRVYRAAFLGQNPRATLVRRIDDEAPVPYMLAMLEADGIMVQVPLPLCLRDEDLDGSTIERPERALVSGRGADFREARSILLPLTVSPRRSNRALRRLALAC